MTSGSSPSIASVWSSTSLPALSRQKTQSSLCSVPITHTALAVAVAVAVAAPQQATGGGGGQMKTSVLVTPLSGAYGYGERPLCKPLARTGFLVHGSAAAVENFENAVCEEFRLACLCS
ncbi:hypothetical protein EJB05_19681, partial [Eragrostis curvula]